LLGKRLKRSLANAMQLVLDYLKQNQSRFVEELCDYLRLPSVSAQEQHKNDVHACAEWLVKHCLSIGLEARLCTTKKHPIVVAKTPKIKSKTKRPHFMLYGHYDVQPPEPLDLWKSKPFEPRIEGHTLFARGSTDNKGQNFAHLKAVEAYLKTNTPLPCDLTFVIEGEEEVGSESLSDFLKTNRKELQCDAIVISDTGMPSPKHPALTYSLRGITAFEIKLTGPDRDLHSGIFGGAVQNPAMALCRLLAQVHDANGRIVIPANIRKSMGLKPGDVVVMSLEDGVLRIESHLARIRRIQEEFKKFVTPGTLASDELIADRREEARREMEESLG